jgi:hypothetical protein
VSEKIELHCQVLDNVHEGQNVKHSQVVFVSVLIFV